jgi:hypothetical protein
MERLGQPLPVAQKLAIQRITFSQNMETYQAVMGRKYRVKEWFKRGLQGLVD